MKDAFYFLCCLALVLGATQAWCKHHSDNGEYVYYKLRDMEERLDDLERRMSEGKGTKKVMRDIIVEGVVDDDDISNDAIEEIKLSTTNKSKKSDLRVESAMDSVLDPRVAEREFYDDAFNHLRENKIDKSEKLFQEFIKKFPGSPLLCNVHYWLGEIQYSQHRFKDASYHFLMSYQLKPSSSKAADSVLKLALSLENLGNVSGACSTLIKLSQEFPSAHREIRKRANIEMTKLRCENT